MIERLPTPWGLVRLGVAPDHPKLKTVSRAFERIAEQPGFRFLGNVEVGRDLTHDDLVRLYDAVIYAVGAQTDRRLGIPGEDLPGSWAATEFVAWYNGHPDYQQLEFDLDVERAVVIGNGNVALDVARMLALTREELAPTDATDASIEAIVGSPLAGDRRRRAPRPGAGRVHDARAAGDGRARRRRRDRRPGRPRRAPSRRTRTRERNLAVLHDFAAREPAGKPRRVVFRFFHSPVAILGEDRVEGIELVRNELDENERAVADRRARDARLRARLPQRRLPRRRAARRAVRRAQRHDPERGRPRRAPGVYCAGWIKRGPTGVIGTNKKDAAETVELLLEDAAAGRLEPKPDATAAAVDALLAERGVEVVEYDGWMAIDEAERAAGEKAGRPRVKLCSWDELLAAAEHRGELVVAVPPIEGHRLTRNAPMDRAWSPSSSNASSCGTTRVARRDRFKHLRIPRVPAVRLPRLGARARADRGRAQRAAGRRAPEQRRSVAWRRHRSGARPGFPTLASMAKAEEQQELWGGETAKAVVNFPVSGEPIPAPVARWLGRIKGAAARANADSACSTRTRPSGSRPPQPGSPTASSTTSSRSTSSRPAPAPRRT